MRCFSSSAAAYLLTLNYGLFFSKRAFLYDSHYLLLIFLGGDFVGGKIRLKPWEQAEKQTSVWDAFVDGANGGNFFHKISFLEYHKGKFVDKEHHLAFFKGEELFGVMPMAIFEEEGRRVLRSPYGASYGGPLFKKMLTYSESNAIADLLLEMFDSIDIDRAVLTFPIPPLYRDYSEVFLLSLYEHGFKCTNRDISCGVPLQPPVEEIVKRFDSRARNMARKATANNIQKFRHAALEVFWPVLLKTYEKHQRQPTHSLEELTWLMERFPQEIYCDVALYDDIPVAGICFFAANKRVNSSFYLASDPQYRQLQALSLLIAEGLQESARQGYDYFDFGTSSVNMRGRPNSFLFKESFGAGGYFRDTYEWRRTWSQ